MNIPFTPGLGLKYPVLRVERQHRCPSIPFLVIVLGKVCPLNKLVEESNPTGVERNVLYKYYARKDSGNDFLYL